MSNPIHQSQPPQATIDQIIGLYNQGQLEQTVSLGESLAKQYPNALILYDILGAAYMGLKNTEKTIASYQKALQLNPNHTDAYNNMGMALYDKGRFDEAVESYQKAIKLEPSFADAHYNLGNALKQTGDLKQAIESYEASLAINPNDAEVLLSYGNALKDYGDFDQATEVYAKVLKVDPSLTAAQTNMDNAIKEKAEIDKNVADYARIIKLEISSAEVVSMTGTFLKAKGYLDAAIDSYEQAIKIKPDYADAYSNMGVALKDKGDLDAAIDSYKHAVKIKPDFAEAYSNMGVALKDKGELDAAIDSCKQAIKIKPDHAEAYNNMGAALTEKGELDAAVDSYRQAIKIKPDYAKAAIGLAKMRIGSLIEEDLEGLKGFLNKFTSNLETLSDRDFLEAGYLMHIGESELAFTKFCEANKSKLLTLGYSFEDQKKHSKYHLQKIEKWKHTTLVTKDNALKKIFILGPSRSGKSTLERILSQSPKIKPLYEAHRVIPNDNSNLNLEGYIDFETVFFQYEKTLIQQGYKAITSTDPNLIYSVMSLADKLPNAHFIFVIRDQKNIAPEVFTSDYQKENYYSYDPHTIKEYLGFYKTAMDRLEEKAPNIISKFTFEQIIENPSSVVEAVSQFTSLDFSLSDFAFPEKKLISDDIFCSHFQKLILRR